jgi:hypothetical protein
MTWRLTDYTEIGRLGSGATGTVVSAWHEPTSTFVAIKFLSARRHGRSTPTDWFRSQVRLLADLDDGNIARLYEYVERPAGGALVMELVDGVSLDELLRHGGPLEAQAALLILKGSLRGLVAAHAKGLLHRDFRPSNVQISRTAVVKIVDFGVVPPVDSMRPSDGTPLYEAPELWDGQPADARTDLYAAAATFVECLTGHPPYPPARTMAELRTAHEEAPIPVADIPEQLRDLVSRGLAKDPANRPDDARSFLRSVEHVAAMRYGSDWERAGESVLLRRLMPLMPPPGRSVEVHKRRRAVALAGSSLLTRVLVGAAAAAAIVMVVNSGIAAADTTTNATSADGPAFAVVLPRGSAGGSSGSPTSIPTLLIIPTPGVTLTAPPVRPGLPTPDAPGHPRSTTTIAPSPIGPPPTTGHTTPPTHGGGTPTGNPTGGGTPTGNPTGGGTPTTAPPTTPTVPPASVTGASLTAFTNDGSAANYDITVTTDGTGPVTIHVSVTENPGTTHSYTFPRSGATSYSVTGTVPVSTADCATSTPTLSISTDASFDSSSVPSTITVVCP